MKIREYQIPKQRVFDGPQIHLGFFTNMMPGISPDKDLNTFKP